jgi:hypothetical protein
VGYVGNETNIIFSLPFSNTTSLTLSVVIFLLFPHRFQNQKLCKDCTWMISHKRSPPIFQTPRRRNTSLYGLYKISWKILEKKKSSAYLIFVRMDNAFLLFQSDRTKCYCRNKERLIPSAGARGSVVG